MRKYIDKSKSAIKKSATIIQDDGLTGFTQRAIKYAYYRQYPDRKKRNFKDILFINGCTLEHPERYRVHHQLEQLQAAGLSADMVFYENLTMEKLKYYRGFVFFRCPETEMTRSFIEEAKKFNKTTFFDIDDLVIDQKYTDKIDFVRSMNVSDKSLYDDGVNRMRKTLQSCEHVITSTSTLQKELGRYTKGKVYVNRNVASDEMVALSNKAFANTQRDHTKIILGYFSGSITHNENFAIVLPHLVRLFKKHDNVYLKVVGLLNVPDELKPFSNRIITVDFLNWRELPTEIAQCDINLAPLKSSIFNEAKSENKWTEASLVRVPTAASNVGGFREVITNRVDGLLVQDEDWFKILDELIDDETTRQDIAHQAYEKVLNTHTTIASCIGVANFIRQNLKKNIGFVLPSTDISGGVNVVLKHCDILREKGWDVTCIDTIQRKSLEEAKRKYAYRNDIPGQLVLQNHSTEFEGYFDSLVATLWSTLDWVKKYPNVNKRLYFVQNYETNFYEWGFTHPRLRASSTYADTSGVEMITMSLWCQQWLKDLYNKDSKYASNGIDLDNYPVIERNMRGKIRILIEGDSQSEYKNVDEAFKVVEKLDRDKFEIHYLSYRHPPKSWYRVDKSYNRVPHEKVGSVYAGADILLKTSLLESFSYPPLEMMATGGYVVALPNEGNVEYLVNNENCLFYDKGNIEEAAKKITSIANDQAIREKLLKGGLNTTRRLSWDKVSGDIIKLYE